MIRAVKVLLLAGLIAGLMALGGSPAQADMRSERVRFDANGLSLSGLLSVPEQGEANALVILVHGYGKTNAVEQNWHYDLRSRFATIGVASFLWDKPGCGDSEGEFDPNQSIESSAGEVTAAAAFLRGRNVPGAHKIGLWGVSRAGWIAPLAASQDKSIAFWISVSGVDGNESFGYLLKSNWRIEGYSDERIDQLYGEWLKGAQMAIKGASYEEVMAATANLREDPFYRYMSGGDTSPTEEAYEAAAKSMRQLSHGFDAETGLVIYVEDFADKLASLDMPVLALFGEQDTSVNWRASIALYERTIGRNPGASLTVEIFPNANHNLHKSSTGGFKEMLDILNAPETAPGYYDVILTWLQEVVAP